MVDLICMREIDVLNRLYERLLLTALCLVTTVSLTRDLVGKAKATCLDCNGELAIYRFALLTLPYMTIQVQILLFVL